ncbi:hypothetical protein CPLU01_14540 [Colletotrichum plurivorum]|uniref:Uncharacterized protein n=1 Tax=Colletotrichum plurivorum TaxID=2175906 RepID=A0A8H6JJP2_9PEZI|nr:hypothetical protein CPLU01_14540 [Colletotrichum plurivorum]
MRPSQLLGVAALASGVSARLCLFPEPERRICYNEEGGTPQNLNIQEVNFTANYLRQYEKEQLRQGGSPFWRMTLPDADNCGEWQVTSKGRTWVMAKLVGDEPAAVLFSDIANTIDGLNLEDPAESLANCTTHGGQMATIVDEESIYYQSQLFEGFTNKGIVIKLVRSPL